MNVRDIEAGRIRAADSTRFPELLPQFRARWSPRAMSGEPVSLEDLSTLLEAARWAPSCFNAQPWRFAWSQRDDAAWDNFLGVLVEGNRAWANRAGALIAVAARVSYEHNGQSAPTHAFDAGAAWMSLALQASHMGLVSHGMWGFHHQQARESFGVPEHYALCAMIAVGQPGDVADLPESVRAREAPSARKPLNEISFAGSFRSLERG